MQLLQNNPMREWWKMKSERQQVALAFTLSATGSYFKQGEKERERERIERYVTGRYMTLELGFVHLKSEMCVKNPAEM